MRFIMKKFLLFLGFFLFSLNYGLKSQNYTVQAGTDPVALVEMLTGDNVVISNVTYAGHANSKGHFWGTSNIGMETGIILASGVVTNSIGPNNDNDKSSSLNTSGDPALTALAGQQSYDASILQFDFVPTGNTFKLKVALASEEYPEFANNGFSDVFGVFLSGQDISGPFPAPAGYPNGSVNIAVIDPTVVPISYISINNINNGNNNNGPCENCQYYVNNGIGNTPALNPYIQYDGFTTVFEIGHAVTPNLTYHLRISVSDVGDRLYDTGLYLEEGSFIASTPEAAGPIAGPATVCYNSQQVTYSIEEIPGATSYIWTLPSGVSGSSTTNTITVDYTVSASSGVISVYGTNFNGNGTASSLNVTINPLPDPAGAITGLANVCTGQTNVVYTVPPIPNAQSYQWSFPTGVTGSSTTNSISVSFGSNANSGDISVNGLNDCGTGASSSIAVTVNSIPAQAGSISGPSQVCKNQSGVMYSIPVIQNATSYTWTLPSGATGNSTTNSITVNFGESASSGNISVYGSNDCGNGVASLTNITVNELPGNAGQIQGVGEVCRNQSNIIYSIPSISNATSYIWTLPPGASGNSSTNSINLAYGPDAQSGNITVAGSNSCGNGLLSNFPVNVLPLPENASVIEGPVSVCQEEAGLVYTVPLITNASYYIWILPPGVSGSSLTNSITVDFGENSSSGNVVAAGANTCGSGESVSLPVTVIEKPANPVIYLIGDTLFSNYPEGNQWYDQSGIIPDATQQKYVVTWDETYYSVVTSEGCSSDPSNSLTVIISGIPERGNLNGITVYPNPFSENLILQQSGNKTLTFSIINASGKVELSGSLEKNTEIQTGGLAAGAYVLRVIGSKGVYQTKLMKK